MSSIKLQELYQSLQTPEGKDNFFKLVSYTDNVCIIEPYVESDDHGLSLDAIPDLQGCRLFIKNGNICISYTKEQQELRWSKYGYKNQDNMYYDPYNDIFYTYDDNVFCTYEDDEEIKEPGEE